jgi:hypothetical protein
MRSKAINMPGTQTKGAEDSAPFGRTVFKLQKRTESVPLMVRGAPT